MSETTAAWKRSSLFDEVLYRFEKDYRAGKNPQVVDYLSGEGEKRRHILLELLHSDLELRLRDGEVLRVSDYLAKFPELAEQPADILHLLAVELRFLREQGQQPQLEQYEQDYGKLLPSSLKPLFEEPRQTPSDSNLGKVIAQRYKLLQVLGQGGMGVVYRALDLALDRDVAVKLLQDKYAAESGVARRFLDEARITGQLQHPGIPAVYEAGQLPNGRPFLAMKLIKGDTLEAMLKADRLKDMLGIFEAVSQAVGYAHAHDVIHRDLKPANIMVGSYGEVQLMDWGLAKVLKPAGQSVVETQTNSEVTSAPTEIRSLRDSDGSFTQAGSVLGTPSYMSPEQAAGELSKVDPRSDVFSLGAILCVMLTGKPPFEGNTAETVRLNAVRGRMEEALQRLTQTQADPDVVALCKRCLSFEPADRPADANEVAQAVSSLREAADDRARQAELAQARAEVQVAEQRRRRRVFLAAGGIIMAVLLAGLGISLWQMNRAIDAEQQSNAEREAKAKALEAETAARLNAEEKTRLATAVSNFLCYDVLQLADPSTMQSDKKMEYDSEVRLRDVVIRSAKAIDGKFPEHPLTEAEIRITLGYTLHGMGRDDLAVLQNERVRELYTRHRGPDHHDTLASMNNLAICYHDLGRRDEALKLNEETLALQKQKLGPDHPETLVSMNNLALSYAALGRQAEALKLNEETLALKKRKLGPDHPDTLVSMNNLANSYAAMDRQTDALKLREETLALLKRKLGPDHPNTLASMNNLAFSYAALGRQADALKLREETLALLKRKLGPEHPDTLQSMNSLAISYYDLGRQAEALKLNEETLALKKRKLGPDHPDTLVSMNNLANSYAAMDRQTDALKLREETLALLKRKLGPDHPNTLKSMHNLAVIYEALGRYADSLKLHEETLALMKRKLGPDHPDTLASMHNLATSYSSLGRQAEALKLREETLALRKQKLGRDHPDTLKSMHNLANSYQALGRQAEALKLCEETLALRKQKLGRDHPDTLKSMHNLADSYADLGRRAEALKLCEEALALQKQKLGTDHPETLVAMFRVAIIYDTFGRHAEALKLREEALNLRKQKLGMEHPDTLDSMHSVAVSYNTLGRHAEALKLREEVLALKKQMLGPDHPDTLLTEWGVIESLTALNREKEALPRINALIEQADRLTKDGKAIHAGLILQMFVFLIKINQKANNLAGCRDTVNRWEKRPLKTPDELYNAACFRAITAALQSKAPGDDSAKLTSADVDQAMQWLQKAIAAGFKNRAHMEKDNGLDFLRQREDFKKLMAELPAPPKAAEKARVP